MVHGDALSGNCFVRGRLDDLRYFDWGHLAHRAGLRRNLAYMMATHWYPERRRRVERPLLDTITRPWSAMASGATTAPPCRGLSPLGADAAPDAGAADDERIPPWVWWSHLERITAAIDDLDCRRTARLIRPFRSKARSTQRANISTCP